jgi:hypothetical protein
MAAVLQPDEAVAIWSAPREQVLSDAQAVLAERKLYYFFRYSWPIIEPGNPFVDSWHLGCLAEHLEAVFSNEINRLVINLPRRRSKSGFCSVAWFCWAWIKQPWTRWGFMSYGQDLSLRDSVKCRDVITSAWYQRHWPIKLKDDRNSQLWFANEQQGYRLATSTGGKVVGFGADVNVWDDGHDYRDAWSPSKLEKDVKVWVRATTCGLSAMTAGSTGTTEVISSPPPPRQCAASWWNKPGAKVPCGPVAAGNASTWKT